MVQVIIIRNIVSQVNVGAVTGNKYTQFFRELLNIQALIDYSGTRFCIRISSAEGDNNQNQP
jgi:hypothetical protein